MGKDCNECIWFKTCVDAKVVDFCMNNDGFWRGDVLGYLVEHSKIFTTGEILANEELALYQRCFEMDPGVVRYRKLDVNKIEAHTIPLKWLETGRIIVRQDGERIIDEKIIASASNEVQGQKNEIIGNVRDNLKINEYKEKMIEAINNKDKEAGHIKCDEVLSELLCELGFEEVVKIWEKQEKWYS